MPRLVFDAWVSGYATCSSHICSPAASSGSVSLHSIESTTSWSFPEHAGWNRVARHYPGNFPPQVARNLILRYSRPGDLVVDPFCGSGTTLVEAGILGRRAIGVDISPKAAKLARAALMLMRPNGSGQQLAMPGDARHIPSLRDGCSHLAILHPPYMNMVQYERGDERDLSRHSRVDEFCVELSKVFREVARVLKSGGFCALLIGDTRRNGFYIPLSHYLMLTALQVGFVLMEEVIKHEWNTSSERRWAQSRRRFLLIDHEHLYVFRKPCTADEIQSFKGSLGVDPGRLVGLLGI